jgi:hypothetical protein
MTKDVKSLITLYTAMGYGFTFSECEEERGKATLGAE